MKVLALVMLVVSSCSGLGSGPYLPSGWRPQGPAFYLPTEVEKSTAAVPLKDVPVQETETSGSSFLREYGPPKAIQVEETGPIVEQESSGSDALREYGVSKFEEVSEVSQDLTVQSLPEPITEQAFVVIEAKFSEEEKSAGVQEAAVEQEAEVVSNNNEQTTTEGVSIDKEEETEEEEVETQTESSLAVTEETTAKLEEVVQEKSEEIEGKTEEASNQEENANVVASTEQKTEKIAEVNVVEEGVRNIAEALDDLENEIKSEQVETEVSVLRTSQESSVSSQQGPEGFLEYGPPGFTEYGPPKGNLAVAAVGEDTSDASLETNETRKRRFSPKFKKATRKA